MCRRFSPFFALIVLVFHFGPAWGAEKELLSQGGAVEVSNQPNPIWSKDKLVDGKDSPTSGWLCNRAAGCWADIALPETAGVDEVWIRQAAFPQTGPRRYARAKEIVLSFDGKGPLRFQLEDREETFQKLNFPARTAKVVRVEATTFYEEASVKELSGFQEIKIFRSPDAAPAPVGGGAGGSSAGEIDEKEKKILNLLGQLMAELEDYFMTN